MDTKTFLERVHAQSDSIVVCTHRPDPTGNNARGIFWNRGSFDSFDAAAQHILTWDAEPQSTVYFGVGSFAGHQYQDEHGRTKWYRQQEYATYFKAVCFDLDVGENKYASQSEASTALCAVLDQLNLPYPMMVSSGRGIHAYWPLTAEISVEQWVIVSSALNNALHAHGFTFDASKIKDPSMVLRPVGTHNKKQEPWKAVKVVFDPETNFDAAELTGILSNWVVATPTPTARPSSSVADAILGPTNDVDIDTVALHCKQIATLVQSGGFVDASGNQVEEPLWRASLGMAKYATDPQDAVIKLAGQHPNFDLDANMAKLSRWNGTGPTTCSTFAQLCPAGCETCPHNGNITSPAQLSSFTEQVVETPALGVHEVELPDSYVVRDGSIYKEVVEKVEVTDVNGATQLVDKTEWVLVSHYQMHVTGIYKNYDTGATTFRLAVKYPMVGWLEEDHEVDVLTGPQQFAKFLANRQIFDAKTIGQQDKIRVFIVDYLSKVQSESPSGVDYIHFGWQNDGSFLCGTQVIGGAADGIDRRLKGAANRFDGVIEQRGTREGWVAAMEILNKPEAKTLRMVMLLAMGSVLSRAAGNCTGLVSIYSHKTTTGKTLALYALNSMFGHPKELLLQHRDTANAMYKIRGVLSQLPCTIDELTTVDAMKAVEMTYDFSSGVEKNSMDQKRELRDPARWTGPTFITTNLSFIQQFDMAQTNDSALRARCLEIVHDDRRLVQKNTASGVSPADVFVDELFDNHGWAYPELVQRVIELGGDELLWKTLKPKFIEKYGAVFRAVDKYAEPMIITGWIVAMLARKQGLIGFDVNQTVLDLIDHLHSTHNYTEETQQDAFDIIGQYMQEHNHQIIEATMEKGDSKEAVRMPPPELAVVRIRIVQDPTTGDMIKGSYLAINIATFKRWLAQSRDGIDRIVRELTEAGALIKARERVTMYKGCPGRNPGQAYCILIDLTHARYSDELVGTQAIKNSKVTEAILGADHAT